MEEVYRKKMRQLKWNSAGVGFFWFVKLVGRLILDFWRKFAGDSYCGAAFLGGSDSRPDTHNDLRGRFYGTFCSILRGQSQ